MDFTLLNKAFGAIRPETWDHLNHALALNAITDGLVTIEHVRTDTTVTECNIHWPTDSSLLLDVYRVAARKMTAGRKLDRSICPWRFHLKKIKKLHLFVNRYSQSKDKKRLRKVKQDLKTLIVRVEDILEKAGQFGHFSRTPTGFRCKSLKHKGLTSIS